MKSVFNRRNNNYLIFEAWHYAIRSSYVWNTNLYETQLSNVEKIKSRKINYIFKAEKSFIISFCIRMLILYDLNRRFLTSFLIKYNLLWIPYFYRVITFGKTKWLTFFPLLCILFQTSLHQEGWHTKLYKFIYTWNFI